jgi:hypothetical protein
VNVATPESTALNEKQKPEMVFLKISKIEQLTKKVFDYKPKLKAPLCECKKGAF